jgi:hypothetical protein
MLAKQCAQALKEKHLLKSEIGDGGKGFVRTALLENSEIPSWEEDVLFIGKIDAGHKPDQPVAVVTDHASRAIVPEGSVVFEVAQEDLREAEQVLTDLFAREFQLEMRFSALTRRVLDAPTLDEAINAAAEFMERSMILSDLSFQIICAASSMPVTDAVWERNLQRGYCSLEFVEAVAGLMRDIQMPEGTEAFLVDCYASTEHKLCSRFFLDGKEMGCLILLDNNKGLEPWHTRYLPRISWLLGVYVERQPLKGRFFSSIHESIIRGLLDADAAGTARQRAAAVLGAVPARLCCLCVYPQFCSDADSGYLTTRIEQLLPGSIAAQIDDEIVVMADEAKALPLPETPAFDDYLRNVKRIGISKGFSQPEDLARYAGQARAACTIAGRVDGAKRICRYADYEFYDMLMHIPDRDMVRDYIHPAIVLLQQYDQINETALSPTLSNYLKTGCSSKLTAAEMYLHRNTLTYRLSRIRELTGLDLEDPDEIFRLRCSYMILQVYE